MTLQEAVAVQQSQPEDGDDEREVGDQKHSRRQCEQGLVTRWLWRVRVRIGPQVSGWLVRLFTEVRNGASHGPATIGIIGCREYSTGVSAEMKRHNPFLCQNCMRLMEGTLYWPFPKTHTIVPVQKWPLTSLPSPLLYARPFLFLFVLARTISLLIIILPIVSHNLSPNS